MKKAILVLFCCLPILGCEKTEYYYLNQEIKDWGLFNEGSYWVYRNINNGDLDSVYVTSTREYSDKNDADKRITSVNEAIDINYSCSDNIKTKVTLYSYDVFTLIVSQDDEIQDINSEFILFRLKSNGDIIENSSQYSIIEKLADFSVNGTTYLDVIHIKTTVENQYFNPVFSMDNSIHEYWVSKHNWIIKKKVLNALISQEWELLRFHIIQ